MKNDLAQYLQRFACCLRLRVEGRLLWAREKMEMRPLPVVDKLLQGLLQVVEYAVFRARYLGMVDGNLGLQLLC